jgi:CheY-like chemotaxis protein
MSLDPELLAAFLPEFEAGLVRFAAEPVTATLAPLRAMAEALGIEALAAPLRAAEEALAAGDAAAAAAEVPALRAALAVLAGGEPPPAAEAPLPVLVVDDSATIRRLLRAILAREPRLAIVAEAADGAEALRLMAAHQPALTLLDLEMPVLDGMGFLAAWALRGVGEVLVVSSVAGPGSDQALEALRRGAAGCVAKPSGALSLDLEERAGEEVLAACRRIAGLVPA